MSTTHRTLPPVHETVHHGVPLRWTPVEGPVTGTLTFGVGVRDEPAHLLGITHLTEHLLFRAAGPFLSPHNGCTAVHVLELTATGTPAEVATVLNALAAVVRAPGFTAHDLERERRVLQAEVTHRLAPGGGPLTLRFGLGGVGNADAGTPTLTGIELPEVLAWVQRWLTRENARLHFTGEPPADLDVRLPSTVRPEHAPLGPSLVTRPTLALAPVGGVTLSFLVPTVEAVDAAAVLDHEISSSLRHDDALVYSPAIQLTDVEAGTSHVAISLDPIGVDVPDALAAAVRLVRRLAAGGVSQDACTSAASHVRAAMTLPTEPGDHLETLVRDDLTGLGHPAPDALVARAEALTPASASAMLATAFETLLVLVDEDSGVDEETARRLDLVVEDFLVWEPTGAVPRRWEARGRARGVTRGWIGVADGALWMRLGHVRRIDLAAVVVAGTFADGSLALVDRYGRHTVVDVTSWRRGEAVVAAALAHVPVELQRDFTWHDRRPDRPDRTGRAEGAGGSVERPRPR